MRFIDQDADQSISLDELLSALEKAKKARKNKADHKAFLQTVHQLAEACSAGRSFFGERIQSPSELFRRMDDNKGWESLGKGDGNRDGSISLEEFAAGLKQLDLGLNRREQERLFHGLDAKGQGLIQVPDLIAALQSHEDGRVKRAELAKRTTGEMELNTQEVLELLKGANLPEVRPFAPLKPPPKPSSGNLRVPCVLDGVEKVLRVKLTAIVGLVLTSKWGENAFLPHGIRTAAGVAVDPFVSFGSNGITDEDSLVFDPRGAAPFVPL